MKTKILCFLVGALFCGPLAFSSIKENPDSLNELNTVNPPPLILPEEKGIALEEEGITEVQPDPAKVLAHGPYQPFLGGVCRNGLWYCGHIPLPVGSYCQCYNIYGYLWFIGTISLY